MSPIHKESHRSTRSELERSVYVPSLPLESWILIFFQNTNPTHLYTVGRKVCSTWRTEIPKVIAKKYLEDPDMVQIRSNCQEAWHTRFTCLLGSELGFSHYQGTSRAVFKPIFIRGAIGHASRLRMQRATHPSEECQIPEHRRF